MLVKPMLFHEMGGNTGSDQQVENCSCNLEWT